MLDAFRARDEVAVVLRVVDGPLGVVARVLAFLLVIAGAALMPAPLRATHSTQGTG